MRNESSVKGNITGKQEGESKSVISRQNLIEEQSNDKELLDLFKITLTPVEVETDVKALPGDRVLDLFPVVGNPLQAKYSGPYKVVKKISDTNYLVKTPGRRKETQVCHINMLKAYNEKPKPELVILNHKLGLEKPMHSERCVGLETDKEEDTESEIRLGNDQQPIKLQNSQIVNELGTKLSHLPLVQKKS